MIEQHKFHEKRAEGVLNSGYPTENESTFYYTHDEILKVGNRGTKVGFDYVEVLNRSFVYSI
jgi:hypothetical protein